MERNNEYIPNYEIKLDKDINPSIQVAFKTPIPVDTLPSIMDLSFEELIDLNIEDVRKVLLKEIKALEDVDNNIRSRQLQKIFSKIFSFHPNRAVIHFMDDTELRLYADLIMTPGLHEISYVRDFLKNNFYFSNTDSLFHDMHSFILNIYDYYDNHSKDAINKFNYVYRNSYEVASSFEKINMDLNKFFSERIVKSFSKEDLCQLYRFYFLNDYRREFLLDLFSDSNAKSLFMISQMAKKVKLLTGHSSEFLESAFEKMARDDNFSKLLEDFYDTFVGNHEGEKSFESKLILEDDFIEMRELINYIINSEYDSDLYLKEFNKNTSVEQFMKCCFDSRNDLHSKVIKKECLSKLKDGSFDLDNDFVEIDDKISLKLFQLAFFNNIYGIGFKNADFFVSQIGVFIDDYEKGIIPEDRKSLEILKAIKNIYDLDFYDFDFKEKLKVVQKTYYNFIKNNGLDYKSSYASLIILESLFSKMTINTYNKRLFKIDDNSKILKIEDGVKVIDAGVNFDAIVTGLMVVGDFYCNFDNFNSKWNTAFYSESQGVCVSHISNENLGVINLDSPFLGFSKIPEEGLNTIAPSDIYSTSSYYNLRRGNLRKNKLFVPGNIMSNETRYGYNELVIDRFLANDKDNKVKIQPDYVVFFNVGDINDEQNLVRYEVALKMAKSLDIPILFIDVLKVKEAEKEELLEMEKELFNSSSCNYDLVDKIVTRYMNNYTGALTLVGTPYVSYEKDFSEEGLKNFLEKIVLKVESTENIQIRNAWINALEDIYHKEKDKYNKAIKMAAYEHSVDTFLLDELNYKKAVIALIRNRRVLDIVEEKDSDKATKEINFNYSFKGKMKAIEEEEFLKSFGSVGKEEIDNNTVKRLNKNNR